MQTTVQEARINLGPSQRAVLASVVNTPRTAEQISVDTGYSGNTVRPRLLELEAEGLVTTTDLVRRTRSGRRAWVWVPTPKGIEVILGR